MEQNPSLKANISCPARQEIPFLLRNPKVRYRVYNSPPLDPNLRQMNPVHTLPSISVRSSPVLSCHLHLGLPNGLFR